MRERQKQNVYGPYRLSSRLATDSIVLSKSYVDAALEDSRQEEADIPNVVYGLRNGLFFSLLIWALVLLLFLAF